MDDGHPSDLLILECRNQSQSTNEHLYRHGVPHRLAVEARTTPTEVIGQFATFDR